jgi:hypothetical protein
MTVQSTGLSRDEKRRGTLGADLRDKYYTEPEWADHRGKSERTVQRERYRRVGAPFVLNGKTPLYPRHEAHEWLRSGLVQPRRPRRRPRR